MEAKRAVRRLTLLASPAEGGSVPPLALPAHNEGVVADAPFRQLIMPSARPAPEETTGAYVSPLAGLMPVGSVPDQAASGLSVKAEPQGAFAEVSLRTPIIPLGPGRSSVVVSPPVARSKVQ